MPCTDCGKTTRVLHGKGVALCKSCRYKDRRCIRCNKLTPSAALILKEGVACPSCARYFKEPAPCSNCGQPSLHLSNDFKNGFTLPACPKCRNMGNITCPSCRRYRKPAGMTSDGRIVCAKCLAVDGQPIFICPKCGKQGKEHSKDCCEDCYWRDRSLEKLSQALPILSNLWAKDSFEGFLAELIERIGSRLACLRFNHYFKFFTSLDALYADPSIVTVVELVARFGKDGLRRNAIAYGYLVKIELLPAAATHEIADAAENLRQKKILEKAKGTWYEIHLQKFYEHLQNISLRYARWGWVGEKRRYVPRTITSNLNGAHLVLNFLADEGLTSLRQIEQHHIDKLGVNHLGSRNSMIKFVNYIKRKEKLFRKFKMERICRDLGPEAILPEPTYRQIT